LVAFFGVITISITQILMNVLNRTEGSVQMVFYMTFFSTLMTAPFAFFMWHTPSMQSLVWITLIAIFAIFNVYALVRAIKLAGISAMMPLDFTRLIVTAILAYFVFGEVPDKLTTLGAAIIIIGAIYVVKKERHAERMADSK
jgi:drug/metabolite transporter (DMT)-like permease